MSMSTTAVPRMEMLQVADAVSKEKNISKAEVLDALEQAIAKAAKATSLPNQPPNLTFARGSLRR